MFNVEPLIYGATGGNDDVINVAVYICSKQVINVDVAA